VRAVRLAGAAAIAAALLVPAARADTTPTGPIYDGKGHVIAIPFAPAHDPTQLTKDRATAIFLKAPKVADWVGRYPKKGLITDATFDDASHDWTVNVWWGAAGEIATGKVDDITGVVLTDRDNGPWTGPQVAWEMARGHPSSFGGRDLNSLPIWLGFCALFLLGLADFRRPLCVRNLDLLVLLSFSVSLWYFNHGRIFTSVPLAYPPMLYLLARMAWVGWRGRAPRASRPLWPVWLLAAATVFLAGFRIGLNVEDGNVIDVGYSGAIGAQRIASGEMPYGHMPTENAGQKACAAADTSGRTAYRIQTNGRCEAGDEHGDTYGPVSYEAYLPGYWAYGWKGIGDELNAARFTSVLFDVLCIVGLALVGLRLGGTRLAVTLAFAWAAYPFTQYVSSSNTNDAIQPAFLIWGFWLVGSPVARGIFSALAGWTKFAALLVAPMWATYPEARRPHRPKRVFAVAFLAATAVSFWILLLEPNPVHAARVFFDRAIRWQTGRDSPFSLWDWRQYHAGLPDLHLLQHVLQGLLVVASVALAFFPRRKSPLQLAALTGALLIGFELVLTHWFYLYLPWFFPFVAFAVLAPSLARERAPVTELAEHRAGGLATAH